MSRKVLVLMVLVIIVASIIPYINAPKGYFIWDDINLILMDYQIKSWQFMTNIFTRDFFGFSDNARKYGYYRPIVTITYALDWRLWDKNPAGYHWNNIGMHLATCLIVFALLLKLVRRRPVIPFVATLLFATNPIHTESITWISGRTDVLCGLFYFLSFYLYIIYSERLGTREGMIPPPDKDPTYGDRSRGYVLFGSLTFYLFALLSKEMAISLPIVMVAYSLLFITKFQVGRTYKFFSSYLALAAVSGGYILLRMYKITLSEQAKDPFDVIATILTFIKTIFLYTWKTAVPVYLTAYMQNELVEEVFQAEFLVPAAFLIGIVWLMFRSIKKNPLLSFAIGFYLISLLPLSNFVRISGPKDMGFMSAERFLYIPSLSWSLVVAMLFAYIYKGSGKKEPGKSSLGWRQIAAVVALGSVLLTYTGLTIDRNRDWYDNETFFTATLETAPNAPILYMLLGNVYSIEQNWEMAEKILKKAIEYLSPRDREEPTWIYSDLAGVYAKQGLYDKALETMKLASKTKFHNSAVEYNYGEIYRAMGDLDKAMEYYRRSLMIYRDNVQALVKLGLCYQQTGQYELSNKAYLSALNLLPNDPEVINNIGFNYAQVGEKQKAIHYFKATLVKDADFARAHANLGLELLKLGTDIKTAVSELQAAVRLDPTLVEPQLALGGLIVKSEPEKALAIFKRANRIAPDNVKTMIYLGMYFRDVGDNEAAIEWFEKALIEDPEDATAAKMLGELKNN
jgi:protein O-mannosyl-transferase